MYFKFAIAIAIAIFATANAGYLQADQHQASGHYAAEPFDPNPQYMFQYAVQDGSTGDVKNQHEARNGDSVQGEYSLIDADGHHRTVQYTSNHGTGFNAVVRRDPIGHAPAISAGQHGQASSSYSVHSSNAAYSGNVGHALNYGPSGNVGHSSLGQGHSGYSYQPGPSIAHH